MFSYSRLAAWLLYLAWMNVFLRRPGTKAPSFGGDVDTNHDPTRRGLLKKAAYAAPVILTLQATSALAKSGSEKEPLKHTPKPKKAKKAKKT
jgi:hypothetical protein